MEYNPQQETEIRSRMCLPPGEYNFEIVNAEEKVSRSGNDMIELNLRVFPHDDGSPRLLKDWLVPGSSMGDLKLNRFSHCVGLQSEYFDGTLSALNIEGASGRVRLTIEGSEQYGDQNRVKDYIPLSADEASQEPPPQPQGVPAQQTKRALKKTNAARDDANQALAEAYEEQLAANNDDIPF